MTCVDDEERGALGGTRDGASKARSGTTLAVIPPHSFDAENDARSCQCADCTPPSVPCELPSAMAAGRGYSVHCY